MSEVYAAIAAVQDELARIGISKDKKNAMQGYNFRGIDDVYNVLAPVLAKNKLCILPRVLSRDCVERQTAKGGVLFYVIVACEFDLVSAVDGSKHTVKTYGEAMDSSDKATNKAMSAAYKYAAFQTFCIPVDAEDADATTPEVNAKPQEPDYPVPDPTEYATKDQITKIQIMMKEKGLTDRSAILDELSAFFERIVKSSKELTKEEASEWIDRNV